MKVLKRLAAKDPLVFGSADVFLEPFRPGAGASGTEKYVTCQDMMKPSIVNIVQALLNTSQVHVEMQ